MKTPAELVAAHCGTLEQTLAGIVRRVVREELAATFGGATAAAPRLVTIAAFAKARSLGVSTVREAVREGRLPAVHIGRAVRVQVDGTIAPRGAGDRQLETGTRADRALGILRGGLR